jgi:acetoin utilization deacetylase AcuC-like enzyme
MARAWYSDHFEVPLPEGHRFPMEKYRRLRELLLARGILAPSELTPAEEVPRERLALVHDAAYLDALFSGCLTEPEVRRLGFPWSPALLARSRASVGGTVAAGWAALEHGWAGNLAGGTHHAFADHGEGYCVFNDIAVAIRTLQGERRIQRAVVVDLDVHQGNGTAAIFSGDDSVFTFSMHGEKNFPFRKQRSDRDVELPDGATDAQYLEALDAHLHVVMEASGADILFYQGGVDGLAEDALGRLSLTHAGLRARDEAVFRAAWHRGIPVVLTLGGGYARPIEATLEAYVGTWLEAKRVLGGD